MPEYTESEMAIAKKYRKITGSEPQPGFLDQLRILCGPDMRQLVGEYMAEKAIIIVDRTFDLDALNQKGQDMVTLTNIEGGTEVSVREKAFSDYGISCGINVTVEEVLSEHLRHLRDLGGDGRG